MTRPLRRCLCAKCRHHITVAETEKGLYFSKRRGRNSTLAVNYKCKVCGKTGTFEARVEDYWGHLKERNYQEMKRLVMADSFSPENTEQVVFDKRNKTVISEEEQRRFRAYLSTDPNIWYDLKGP